MSAIAREGSLNLKAPIITANGPGVWNGAFVDTRRISGILSKALIFVQSLPNKGRNRQRREKKYL